MFGRLITFWIIFLLFLAALIGMIKIDTASATVFSTREPISIEGDANFTSGNGVSSGAGTEADPYIIKGWDINSTSTHCIEVKNTTAHFIIRNVNLTTDGIYNYGIYFFNVKNGSINDSEIYESRVGIRLFESENINIIGNNLTNNRFGIENQRSSNINIIGNNISHDEYDICKGIYSSSGKALNISFNNLSNLSFCIDLYSSPNSTINNNFLTGKYSNKGIKLTSSHNTTIFKNDITMNSGTGMLLITSSGVSIINNEVTNSYSGNGIQIEYCNDNIAYDNNVSKFGNGFYLYHSINIDVNNNFITSCSNGIYLLQCYDYNKIGYNTITVCHIGILNYYSINSTIIDNKIFNNNYGVSVSSSEFTDIIDNTIYNNTQTAIIFHSTGIIIDNTIFNNTLGISLRSYFIYVKGNYIFSNSGLGIDLDEFSASNIIYYNKINNNSGGGINIVSSNNNQIENNTILSNGFFGINLYQAEYNRIGYNEISMNDDAGIESNFGWKNTIFHNIIDNNTQLGIDFYYSQYNSIRYNTITNNSHGIYAAFAENCTIDNNTIVNNIYGVSLARSKYNTFKDNEVKLSSYPGLKLDYSQFNTIFENTIYQNDMAGVMLYSSKNNLISHNDVFENHYEGFRIIKSEDNNIYFNDLYYNNGSGLLFEQSENNFIGYNVISNNNIAGIKIELPGRNFFSYNSLIQNGFFFSEPKYENWMAQKIQTTNTVNGKPVYFWQNRYGGTIPPDAGQVILVSCENIKIDGLTLSNSTAGIQLFYSKYNTISNITSISNSKCALYLYSSSENTIVDSSFSKSTNGIVFDEYSEENLIKGNNITNNEKGIVLSNSYKNKFYWNNFIDNELQPVSVGLASNTWDNGYPSGGNYWSDYDGEDENLGSSQVLPGADGIGDTEYKINTYNIDEYPLMKPYLAQKPTAPRNLKAGPGISYVQFSWDPPSSEGRFPIIGYHIYRGSAYDAIEFREEVGKKLYFNDTTVANGMTYFYKVCAVNIIGSGSFTDIISVEPGSVPTNPLELTATPIDDEIQLTWKHPLSNGGLKVTSYKIYRGIASGIQQFYYEIPNVQIIGGIVTYYDKNVTAGIRYYYRVSAVNSIGEGELSSEVSGMIITIPSVPTNVTATPGDSFISLTWAEPAFNGGSAIQKYYIYQGVNPGELLYYDKIEYFYYPSGFPDLLIFNDTDLTNDVTHYYSVSAVNGVGEGPLSDEISATPAPPLNKAPTAAIGADITSGEIPLRVEFTGTGYDLNGDPLTYSWDFDDGNTSTKKDPVHVFFKTGVYSVKLTVTDYYGAAGIAMITITVEPKSIRPPNGTVGPGGDEEEGKSYTKAFLYASGATLVIGIVIIILILFLLPAYLQKKMPEPKKEKLRLKREINVNRIQMKSKDKTDNVIETKEQQNLSDDSIGMQ